MATIEPSFALRVYVALLTLVFALLLVVSVIRSDGFGEFWPWIVFTFYLALAEYSDLNFYDVRSRLGLSASEAILFPMIVALPFEQLVWAFAVAVSSREVRRLPHLKGRFNVAQYTCSAAAGAAIWGAFADTSGGILSPRNVAVLVSSVLAFSIMTHLFTSLAIAISERRSFLEISGHAFWATMTYLVGSMILGLLFAAAYVATRWTVFLFPLVIGVFYVGYRAFLSQGRERERVEKLHEATRALAASANLNDAVQGFLSAVQQMVSSRRALLFLSSDDGREEGRRWTWTEVRGGHVYALMKALEVSALRRLLEHLRRHPASVVLTQDEQSSEQILSDVDASSLVAVPLRAIDQEVGFLVVMDRVGADEFDDDDARLLEALANELQLSLESYRLFAEIAEERERFGRIFSGSKEGICLIDSAGRVKAWNPALETIAGYASDEVMDRVWSDVLLIRDHEENRIEGEELVGVEPDEELELVTKSGPSRWITTLAGPVGEAEGGGWVILIRDVTAEHEVEEAKSDFLSTISHELRTPLTSIKGSLQVLGRGLDELPTDMAEQMITVTTRGADRLERLVMNLLAVSQLESGTMAVFPDEVLLGEVVHERVDAMLSEHRSTRIELPDDPIIVRADRERLSHVLEHLLENARKFGGPEGTIVIAADVYNGYARLSVSDEGPGIPAADHDRIFDRFARLGNVLTRETQGAGVGLFIAKRSVESMGGTISIEGEPGRGATFTMTLPLAKPMALSAGADSDYGA